jgi:hypothetical protein
MDLQGLVSQADALHTQKTFVNGSRSREPNSCLLPVINELFSKSKTISQRRNSKPKSNASIEPMSIQEKTPTPHSGNESGDGLSQ